MEICRYFMLAEPGLTIYDAYTKYIYPRNVRAIRAGKTVQDATERCGEIS